MIWKVAITSKFAARGKSLSCQIKDLGIHKEVAVSERQLYFIETDENKETLRATAEKLLIDPITEDFTLSQGLFSKPPFHDEITITFNPGVCDPVAQSLAKALGDLGIRFQYVRTGRWYRCKGLEADRIRWVAEKLFYNPLIEHILDYEKVKKTRSLNEFANVHYEFKRKEIDIVSADDEKLLRISKEGSLSLTLTELTLIKNHFAKKNRNPTDCELETIAQTWSEHCAHKTFRGIIDYTEKDEKGNTLLHETITNLLKSTVIKATDEINAPGCVSVFDDNSGVVKFSEAYNLCFKVETHNHPSSLEPYGGASTGICGVIRDILGTGCGARPIASCDVFCFSNWHLEHASVPEGLLHPKRIIKGVVGGVRDYGNKMGIPTISGAVVFDDRFLGNPLVYCGTVGIIPQGKSFKKVEPHDCVIVCGARTGRDGIHGATFSSVELTEDTVGLTSAVQIGNPIEEKKLTEAIIRARDEGLFDAITDCGAGGLSSAVGELAAQCGVRVWLDKVPLKYEGLSYTEIWISESQERMVIFAKEKNVPRLKEIFAEEDVEMTVIGRATEDKKLSLFFNNVQVAELEMDFLHTIPRLTKNAVWIKKKEHDVELTQKKDYTSDLQALMGRPNIAPKDWIVRQYDHEVQGASCLKPIVGIERVGLSDASVIRPQLDSKKCIAIGVGINPAYSDSDAYWMAAVAIDEALRNITCVGGRLDQTYILDNFSWGSPLDAYLLGDLVRAAKACYDYAVYYGTPFISGKDSLFNEYVVGGERIAIPGTLLISALSILDSPEKIAGSQFTKEGSLIYCIGTTSSHMGQSEYFRMCGVKEGFVPQIDKKTAKGIMDAVSTAIAKGLIASCHDCSEGGLAVAIAEMASAARKGATVFLNEVPTAGRLKDYEILFSETPSRFIVEVEREKQTMFEEALRGVPKGLIGCVQDSGKLVVQGASGEKLLNADIEELYTAGLNTFSEFR